MEVLIYDSADVCGSVVARIIERQLHAKPASVVGLATGSSPLAVYQKLIDACRTGATSFRQARAFLLDEYVGLADGHPQAYRSFIRNAFTSHIDIDDEAVVGPPTDADSLRSGVEMYDVAIQEAGGIDVQLLGIGSDGHIGFNEPGSSLRSKTRLKTLTSRTRQDNARFFDGELEAVPQHVVTQGIGTILEARHIVLIATGLAKAEPVASAIEGPVAAMVPASALQLHQHVTVVLDEKAASSLTLGAYFREVQAHKPSWQQP